ncbi:DUF1801 domain-containing protein [Cognatishimia sp. SS12]|uniref:DUF1801 domain-containing protein n=1 Tax=Cognatishimia sp. SS12 TaxID=2979465 RepID=UPI00232F4B72|nr:DUF1801 domain-containing protein [Cognatishimia sp. SS12]MDC0737510.1 DUF1801 domain-containing protein [Cognatishimia sp. SS12]
MTKAKTIADFHAALDPDDRAICDLLKREIDAALPEADSKIWHAHPVWFLRGNPIVGYSRLKSCLRLMFWSGSAFETPGLTPGTGKFQDASARYQVIDDVDSALLRRWLQESREIQFDYRNIRQRRGVLQRI